MVMEKKVVEVVAEVGEELLPIGIMNADQASSLPSDVELKISHPDDDAGETDRYLDREEFDKAHSSTDRDTAEE